MIVEILEIFFTTVVLIAVVGVVSFKRWKYRLVRKLMSGSRMCDLPRGPVEYARMGDTGRVLLISHGGGSGYDNIYLYADLLKEGVSLLCPSQPGCVRTPLAVATTFEAQADMMAELLEAMGIREKVAVLGISLGGPAALQFALRHPEKTACLVMQDAVSMAYEPNDAAKNSAIGKVFLSKYGRDVMGWMMDLSARIMPVQTFAQFLVLESLHDKKTCSKLAKELMKDRSEQERMRGFMNAVSPMSLRQTGMDHQLVLSARLPRFPVEHIRCPTLVTHGTDDADVPIAQGRFTATIPGAEFHELSGYGHMFWFGEEGKKAFALLGDFLKRHLM